MKNILLILLLVPFLFACPDDDDNPTPPPEDPTKKELAVRTWEVNKVTVNGSTLDASNYSFNFSDDNNFTISAPDVDDPDFPASGTWAFNSNETKIILNNSAELVVIMLTEDDFILEYSYQNFKEGTVRFRFEMVPAN